MITREIIATDDPAAASLLPFARKEFAKLRERRLTHKLPLLKRSFHINGLMVLLYCGQYLERITILGSYTYHMLFSAPGLSTQISTYNYLTDVLRAAVTIPRNIPDLITAFANMHCPLGDVQDVYLAGGWKAEPFADRSNYVPIAASVLYEVELLAQGQNFAFRTFDGFAPAASSFDPVLPFAGNYLNLFGVTHYPATANWNLWQGASLSYISPANAGVGEAWTWVPSFFIVDPGDAFGLKPGWYYGVYPNSDYSFDDALVSANVSLVGFIETRNNTTALKTGWVECVTSIDGDDMGDINFFFAESLPDVGAGTAYRELVLGLRTRATMTVGAVLQGFAKTFSIPSRTLGTKPDKVVAWNFAAWTNPDALTPQDASAFGALVVEGSSCRAYRWKGYASNFFNTEKYHSHAVSSDGTLVAIFEGESIIESVSVFDLFGLRSNTKEPAEYSSGGYTELQVRSDVAQLSAMSGCFIPTRAKDFTPAVPLFTLGGLEVKTLEAGSRDYTSSLSTLVFIKNGSGALTISKLLCENGVDAEYGTSVDECFTSTVYIDDPELVTETNKLVSSWYVGGAIKGKVRGDFVGEHPNMKFDGITEGDPMLTVTLPKTLAVGQYTNGDFYVDGVVGDLTLGGCFNADMTEKDSCKNEFVCNGGEKVFTAASSCGQTGEYTIEVSPPTELMIFGGDTTSSEFSASGGVQPYTWSISCGEIDKGTGEIIDASGCCGSVTVTVTDSCGESASLDIRAIYGYWNTVSITRVGEGDDWLGCTSATDPDRECWQGFSTIEQTFCGDCSYYFGPTSRAYSCRAPAFAPYRTDDCEYTTCYIVRQQFQCVSMAHIQIC